MSTKMRATFLIVAAGMMVFHLSPLEIVIFVVGYWIASDCDQWLTRRAGIRAIEKIIEDETMDWEKDPEDPDHETKGDFSRIKLPQEQQIVVTRVALILRRLERAKIEKSFGGFF
jgi:hypothetical protein